METTVSSRTVLVSKKNISRDSRKGAAIKHSAIKVSFNSILCTYFANTFFLMPPADRPSSFYMPESVVSETDAKPEVLDTLYQKPVPRKRTKLYNLQDPAAEGTSSASTGSGTESPISTQSVSASSESRSTASVPVMSTNSGVRSLPPRGILKNSSCGSPSDFKMKSRLPQPLKRLNSVPTDISSERLLDDKKTADDLKDDEPPRISSQLKSTLPKSRLPLPMTYLEHQKPLVQPQPSLKSTKNTDEHKNTSVVPSEHDSGLHSSESAKTEDRKIFNKTTKDVQSNARIRASSPFEALLSVNERPTQHIPSKKTENPGYMKEYEDKAEQEEHPQASAGTSSYFLSIAVINIWLHYINY